jgi:hypothetical protein
MVMNRWRGLATTAVMIFVVAMWYRPTAGVAPEPCLIAG